MCEELYERWFLSNCCYEAHKVVCLRSQEGDILQAHVDCCQLFREEEKSQVCLLKQHLTVPGVMEWDTLMLLVCGPLPENHHNNPNLKYDDDYNTNNHYGAKYVLLWAAIWHIKNILRFIQDDLWWPSISRMARHQMFVKISCQHR